ncbi:MAG: hypothetical protein K2J83_03355, partial [Clostridia bacterium]|nr:hypothetical protein [Clostridia bacterium]
MKPPIGVLILRAIQWFVTIGLILSAGLCLSGSGFSALILVECAYIVFKGFEWLVFYHDKFTGRLRRFFSAVSAGAVAIIIAAIAGVYITDPTAKSILNFVIKTVALILAFPIVVPMMPEAKSDDKWLLSTHDLTSTQRTLFRLFSVLYRICVPVGMALTIFAKHFIGFYFESLIIAGCVFWCARYVVELYCWWNCAIVYAASSEQEYDNGSCNDTGERTLNEHDVYLVVKKIADKWSYREEQISAMTQGSVRYNVSFDVSGDRINYSVSGKLSSVSNAGEAQTYARSKIDKAAFNIKEETGRELQKLNLPHSYEINVDIG